jgi:hypothetical protein
LLQVVDLLSLAQVLDVTALRQTLQEPLPQELLLVEHQASVDVQVVATPLQVQDLLAQDRTAFLVTLAAEHTRQVYSITRMLALVALVVLVVVDSQTVTL